MGVFRPENHSPAHGIVCGFRKAAFYRGVISAEFRACRKRMENAEDVGKFSRYAPVGEIMYFVIGIGNVIPEQGVFRIEPCDKLLDFLIRPDDKIPCGDQKRRMGISGMNAFFDQAVGVKFQLLIFTAVLKTAAFRKPDGMEEIRRSVMADVRPGQFEIVFQIAPDAEVPYLAARFAVVLCPLRQEFRLDGFEKLRRRPAVPVGHGAAVFGMHQIAFPCIGKDFLSELAAIFQRTELRPVVIRAGMLPHTSSVRLRVGDNLGKRLLEQVVDSDPEHEKVQAFFQKPVDLSPPVFEVPELRLKTFQPPVREVADAAILKTRAFRKIETAGFNGLAFRYPVPVRRRNPSMTPDMILSWTKGFMKSAPNTISGETPSSRVTVSGAAPVTSRQSEAKIPAAVLHVL